MESPKRRVPTVEPVLAGGIRYEVVRGARALGFAQNGGVIAAIDAASGKQLWTLAIYDTVYDAAEEADAQDRFITRMTLSPDGTHLLVDSENQRSYAVNLSDRRISLREGNRPPRPKAP